MKPRFPIQRFLALNVYKTREEMGQAAARDAASAVKRYIKEKGKAVVVFAAAPSQNEFLFHLAKARGIDWSKVICFHLDEYIPTLLRRICGNTFSTW
jgi:glucosamine-6-phosphate deaminase